MALDPTNDYVCHALSSLEIRHRNYDTARQVLEKVVWKKPTATLCVTLSELERQVGKPERAKEVLLHGLRVCKRDRSKLLLSLAWLEEDFFGNSTNAMNLFEEAMAIDSTSVRVYVAKANMELRLNKLSEARETLRKASKLDAEDAQHYTMWATIEIEAGNYDLARKILAEGSQKYPGDHFLLQRWGTLESKHGNTSRARELFEKSIMIKPHAPTFVAWALLEEEFGMQALAPKKASNRDVKSSNFITSQPSVQTISTNSPANLTTLLASTPSSFSSSSSSSSSFPSSSSSPLFPTVTATFQPPHSPIHTNPTTISSSLPNAKVTVNVPPAARSVDKQEEIEFFLDSIPSPVEVPINSPKSLEGDEESLGFTSLREMPQFPSPTSMEAKCIATAQFEKARQLFNFGMLLDPHHGPLYHAYGNFEMARGNITGARDLFVRGVSMNCSDATSLYHAWGLLELKHDAQTAREIFHKGIELGLNGNREVDSGVGFLLHSLGMLELDCGKADEAKRVFSTGISLFPQHSHLLLGLAMANVRLGNLDASREQFRAAVDADPFHAHAWQSWAVAEKQSGNIELARVLFRQGLKKGPNHGALWQAFAIMEMQQGNLELARTLFAQGLKRCPSHAQSYQAWACLEVRLGDLAKAKALVQHGIRQDPSHPALWSVAGHVEERLGDVAQARNIFEMALRQFPQHGPLYKGLGELEARQGAYLRARECFSKGLQKDPQYPSVYHAAALLEAKLGNLEGLAKLHHHARERFQISENTQSGGEAGGDAHDVIERIRQLEVHAHEESVKSGTAGNNFGAFESVYSIFSAPTR